VKACRIVVDKTTGKPKGTAFIEFKDHEPAAAAAAASARARDGKGPGVTVKGVALTVDLALTQDDARRLGVERGVPPGGGVQGSAVLGGKYDRRNLYLSKEGFIEEGSAVWAAMSENDRWAVRRSCLCTVELLLLLPKKRRKSFTAPEHACSVHAYTACKGELISRAESP
jgi:nucleolar protein 4